MLRTTGKVFLYKTISTVRQICQANKNIKPNYMKQQTPQLALDLIQEAKTNKLTRLDLGKTGLRAFPMEVLEVEGLEELILSNRYWDIEGNLIFGSNQGSDNILTEIPVEIGELIDLKVLIFAGDFLGKNWTINDISPLKQLRNLEYLNLSNNEIVEIQGLEELKNLQGLDLSFNEIVEIQGLEELKNLQGLDLSGNQIVEIQVLEQLKNLEHLDLSGNQIVEIQVLEQLKNLEHLNLSYNQIKEVNLLKSFKKLSILSLYNNPIHHIPKALLLGNNWEDNNCLKDIQSWWAATEADQDCKPNTTVKLLLMGNGGTGKSSLLCALEHGRCSCPKGHKSTHGIVMKTLDIDGITFQIWDFAGQEIYHGTHQLFMSGEAIQIIVFDPKTEKKAKNRIWEKDRINEEDVRHHKLHYWLDNAKRLSPDSKFILVQNKKDEIGCKTEDTQAIQLALNKGISQHIHVSARTGEGMEYLQFLLKMLAKQLREYGMLMPKSWLKVRKFFIKNQTKDKSKRTKLLSPKEFKKRCQKSGLPPSLESTIPALQKLLHHGGYLYAHQEYLGQQIIADQEWALEAIYAVLRRKGPFYKLMNNPNFGQTGRVDEDTLFMYFGTNYRDKDKRLFLKLMQSCRLCFKLEQKKKTDENQDYIFPQFLSAKASENAARIWDFCSEEPRGIFYYRRQYESLGYYQIQRFIVALGQKTELENIWRTGILVKTPEGYFKVFADLATDRIYLSIQSSAYDKWLPDILEMLHGQPNRDQAMAEWEVKENGKFYKVKDLEAHKHYLAQHRETTTAFQDLKPVVHRPHLKVFLSHSLKDRALKRQLEKHFVGSKQVTLWSEEDIVLGKNRKKAMKEHLAKADLILFLLSSDFLKDAFVIKEKLLPAIVKRGTPFLNVYLRPMSLNNLPDALKEQNIIPHKNGELQPVVTWENVEEAYVSVAGEIEKHVRVFWDT